MILGNNDQTGSCSALAVFETLPSSTDYYVPPNRAYNGSLLANCFISLADPTMIAGYLAELQLPTDEFHHIRNKRRKVPLGLSGA